MSCVRSHIYHHCMHSYAPRRASTHAIALPVATEKQSSNARKTVASFEYVKSNYKNVCSLDVCIWLLVSRCYICLRWVCDEWYFRCEDALRCVWDGKQITGIFFRARTEFHSAHSIRATCQAYRFRVELQTQPRIVFSAFNFPSSILIFISTATDLARTF